MTDRDLMQQALDALENLQGLCTDAEDGCLEAITIWTPEIIDALRERLAQPEQEPVAGGWSVFNTGAEVASNLSFDEAWDYMTSTRLDRGWSAVCVLNKDNLPTTTPQPAQRKPLYTHPPTAQPKQESFEYWNAVEGWVKIDEVREHFDSVGCGTIYKTAGEDRVPVYTTPPQRTWVGLTDKEAMQICVDCGCMSEDWLTLLDAIEAKLKERNT